MMEVPQTTKRNIEELCKRDVKNMRQIKTKKMYRKIVKLSTNVSCTIILMGKWYLNATFSTMVLYAQIFVSAYSKCLQWSVSIFITTPTCNIYNSFYSLTKYTTSLCMISYVTSIVALDENLRMYACNIRENPHKFCKYVMKFYYPWYFRKPSYNDI